MLLLFKCFRLRRSVMSAATDVLKDYFVNPVLRDPVGCARFNQYLRETWPDNAQRRGSAVISNKMYTRIIACLRGRRCRKTFRDWVKVNKFFLLEYPYAGAPNAILYLAIPSDKAPNDGNGPQSFRIVAQVEEFVYVIGQYHNDLTGHPGIRRTYAKVGYFK